MESHNTPTPDPLATHLRALRQSRGLTLEALASASGISRATLSRIETGEVSPTAATLGSLARAFDVTTSQLIAPMDVIPAAHIMASAQPVWHDPSGGYTRRSVSPPAPHLKAEVIHGTLAPDQVMSYDAPVSAGQEHHLVLLDGTLEMTVDGAVFDLKPGDCLRYCLIGASRFAAGPDGARYHLVLLRQ